jgi:hypothetical protein
MAKQQGSGIVAGARRVSDVQGRFQNLASTLVDAAGEVYNKGLDKKKEGQIKAKAGLARANALMTQFKDDVDYLAYSPEEQTLIKNKVVGIRNEYADLANIASKIEDKTSSEYQSVVDQMNMSKNKMVNLAKNANARKELRAGYKEGLNGYSTGGFNADAINRGAIIAGNPISKIDDNGEIVYLDDNGDEFLLSDYKLPASTAPAKEVASKIFDISDTQARSSGSLDEQQLKGLRFEVENLIGDEPAILQTFLTNGEISPFVFDNIDPDDPTAKEQMVDRIMIGLADTRGSLTQGKKSGKGGTQLTYPQQLKAADKKEVISQIQGGYDKPIATGRRLKNGQELFLTLNTRAGKWVLTDAAGTAVAGAGGNMVTFDTEEKATAYIK